MSLLIKFFALGFSALLPLINPLGSAVVFAGLVGNAPAKAYHQLARKVAIDTALFLVAIELVGTAVLTFFGVSLPVMQVSGGIVLAAMGWRLLNQVEPEPKLEQEEVSAAKLATLNLKASYPLTFPLTAGPGTVVVMLTLSAHASVKGLLPNAMAYAGILLAVLVLCASVYLCYAYAPIITRRISPQTAQGGRRVIAFVLLCIGVQITWNGLESLLRTLLRP